MIKKAEWIGRCAWNALIEEVNTSPKPGLVDLYSNGAHTDMDAETFRRSADALRPFFVKMAQEGLTFDGTAEELDWFPAETGLFTCEKAEDGALRLKTDAGYLNIKADGAYISSTPQHLMVKTEDNFATIMLTTGEYLDSNAKVCPTYALNCTNKVFGSEISRNNTNTIETIEEQSCRRAA